MRSKSGSMFYSFDILKSDPSSPSLQHIASSATYGNRALYHNGQNIRSISSDGSTPTFRIAVTASSDTTQDSTIPDSRGYTTSDNRVDKQPGSQSGSGCLSFPVFGSAPVRRNQCGEVSDSDDEDLSASNSGKRHICSICLKRFNRPSSLKIHVNTHTGVTRKHFSIYSLLTMPLTRGDLPAFRCPWPNCGREFNVNSNMRRHYRNHTMPGSKAVELRRRRRGVPPSSLVDFDASSSHTSHLTPISSMNSPSLSGRSDSEDSDEELPTPMDECDEIRSGADGASGISKSTTYQASRYYSQSHIRTLRYDSASRSPSPSSSSRSPDHVYTPSAPYIQSFMDPRVSTALRPVFHPAFPVPSAADTKERR